LSAAKVNNWRNGKGTFGFDGSACSLHLRTAQKYAALVKRNFREKDAVRGSRRRRSSIRVQATAKQLASSSGQSRLKQCSIICKLTQISNHHLIR